MSNLRLNFPSGTFNEYRLNQNQVEFRTGDGTWRILAKEDLQLHFALHTQVARWLQRESGNANRPRRSTYWDRL